MLEQMVMILRLQKKERFAVIHAHGFTSGLAALPCRYICGVPVVVTTHGTELLWPRRLWWKDPLEMKLTLVFERFVLHHCDVVIAQSVGVQRYMMQIYGDDLERKIRIIHTGVDHQKFLLPPKQNGPQQILFVGALSEIKGVSCLLKAFHAVHDQIPEAKLALVGSGPRAQEYKKLVKEMNLDSSVSFCGPIRDDARLLKLYQDSDVVVLPSNVGGPVSCTVLEGLSCGKAVISTDLPGGLHDVLADGSGILVRPEDDAGLALELKRLLTDQTYLNTLEKKARRAVEERYTLDSMAEKLTSLYKEIAS